MKINSITFNKRGGAVIGFTSFDTIACEDVFLLEHDDKKYYFSADTVAYGVVSDVMMAVVTATEIGYYAKRIKTKQVNIREILNSLLSPVTDENILKKINEEARWC